MKNDDSKNSAEATEASLADSLIMDDEAKLAKKLRKAEKKKKKSKKKAAKGEEKPLKKKLRSVAERAKEEEREAERKRLCKEKKTAKSAEKEEKKKVRRAAALVDKQEKLAAQGQRNRWNPYPGRMWGKDREEKPAQAQVDSDFNWEATSAEEVVETSCGKLSGLVDRERGIRSYRGIPFGALSGHTRFRAPRHVAAWSGVRECTTYGKVAPQPTYSFNDAVLGEENCLTLDIVRPDDADVLPVVVYFHGGSFITGSSHDPMLRGFDFARSADCVYVSINFRLGALGFLDLRSLGDDCVANPALYDQLLALRWVKENISAFGGDPNQVTLMGESAGANSVITLMSCPAAHGLFHRVIVQSAPAAIVHSITQSTFWARELLYRMALPATAGLKELREAPYEDVVRAGQAMMWRTREIIHLNSCYGPAVDGAMVPDHPLDSFAAANQAKVPMLMGTNADELSFSKAFYLRTAARNRAAQRLLRAFDPENADTVLAAYGDATSRADFSQLVSDSFFWAPSITLAARHAAVAPTWMYRFDYAPSPLKRLRLGAIHALELSAVFGTPSASKTKALSRPEDAEAIGELTSLIQRYWRNFIHHGDPGVEWPHYEPYPDSRPPRATMVFDEHPRVVYDPQSLRRRAWESYDMREWGVGRPELMEELGLGGQ